MYLSVHTHSHAHMYLSVVVVEEDDEMMEMLEEKEKEIEELTVRCHELMLEKKKLSTRAAEAEARYVNIYI